VNQREALVFALRAEDMAYQLKTQETVADGLRRLAREQLKSARDELRRASPPPVEAIHQARKSLKKVRAIRFLIAADQGRGIGGDKRALRKVNRTLSSLRDASVMLEILRKLKRRHPRLLDEHTFARIRRRLMSHKQASLKAAVDSDALDTIDAKLRAIRRDVKGWQPSHRGFRALAGGLRRTFRLGRKALARARRTERPEDFHAWRKQVKALWYDLRLIEGCSPGFGDDVEALHRADQALGDDHNIAVLIEALSTQANAADRERVQRAADRYRQTLRRDAFSDTRQIFSGSARGYVRRAKRAWKEWHRAQRSATALAERMHAA
jgi:CHAD domain-containing protein